jgi:hypothetical protein
LSAQNSSQLDKVIPHSDAFFEALYKKTFSIEQKLDKKTHRYLNKLQKQENKLRKKLYSKDSTLAKQLFNSEYKNEQLKKTPDNVNQYHKLVYSGHLDSLSTALNFLKAQHIADNPSLQKTLSQYNKFQQKLNASDITREQLLLREQMLKEQFEKLGMLKQMKQYRKQVYYYQQQIKEFQQAFDYPSKLEAKLMEVVMQLPKFKDFFAKNSRLGSLFTLPCDNTINTAAFEGLQTREMVNQFLINRFGSSNAGVLQLQQNIQLAQEQLNILKNKISSYSNESYGNIEDENIPAFKTNNQKTKSFLKRLEYGVNIQSQRARYFFPATSDIAVSIGYKINDKSIIGIGIAYKLGWGSNWNNVKLSHQGMGLRSYLDYKIKGSFYFSGGYEQNYRNMINSASWLKDYSAWQNSGLIGLSKKYSISKKMKGEIKLLWDFMSYQQAPRTEPILFRVGYSLK